MTAGLFPDEWDDWHAWRDRPGARPLHLASCSCWRPPPRPLLHVLVRRLLGLPAR